MGMYTEINISLELNKDVPDAVIGTLLYMTGQNGVLPDSYLEEVKKHELFGNTRWKFMLQENSYYFDMTPQHVMRYDEIREAYVLSVRSNFKNYDGEITKFLDWIKPYTQTQGFIGYSRYEEAENPTLIYF